MTIGDWLWKLTRLAVWLGMAVFMVVVIDDKHWYHWVAIVICAVGTVNVLEERR